VGLFLVSFIEMGGGGSGGRGEEEGGRKEEGQRKEGGRELEEARGKRYATEGMIRRKEEGGRRKGRDTFFVLNLFIAATWPRAKSITWI
jgi:hypothetical protein